MKQLNLTLFLRYFLHKAKEAGEMPMDALIRQLISNKEISEERNQCSAHLLTTSPEAVDIPLAVSKCMAKRYLYAFEQLMVLAESPLNITIEMLNTVGLNLNQYEKDYLFQLRAYEKFEALDRDQIPTETLAQIAIKKYSLYEEANLCKLLNLTPEDYIRMVDIPYTKYIGYYVNLESCIVKLIHTNTDVTKEECKSHCIKLLEAGDLTNMEAYLAAYDIKVELPEEIDDVTCDLYQKEKSSDEEAITSFGELLKEVSSILDSEASNERDKPQVLRVTIDKNESISDVITRLESQSVPKEIIDFVVAQLNANKGDSRPTSFDFPKTNLN